MEKSSDTETNTVAMDKSSDTKTSLVTKTLPPVLIAEILARLRVKSLCRFRCVSKLNLALITHPKFAKMHIYQTQRHGLVFPAGSLYSIDPEALSCVNKLVAVEDESLKMKLNYQPRDYFVSIRGSCNGLLCLTIGRSSLVFYNPSTKDCKQISEFRPRYSKCGLGYADSIDDYKYVKIYDDVSAIWVYSLRNDSWKEIPNNFTFYSSQMSGIPLNEALHWLVYDHAGPNRMIVAFDLVEEKFKTLPLPDIMIKEVSHSYSFGILGGCLCLFTEEKYQTLQLWIMKEYAVKESWTKILTAEGHSYLHPLCYLNNNSKTILVKIDFEQLMFWDPTDEKFKIIEVEGIETGDFLPRVYVESIVSPYYRNDIADDGNNNSSFS
ncbi:hypothetical protein JRO89_XS06G0168100 [Xanthoceras sorbifolium]|uniref:F-box domain-containing protein n=1 Tax=Xanthoceras sorbifolium TaxID=99658 RepID=A0ABQ8HYR7_9ROSI|nr:hypothetical protein JRO89_XS06G0168100 [Xanthoceras sorbifolium]